MRRRRIAFMLRATVMAAPSFITTCGSQTHTPEPVPTPPPAVEASEAARLAGQPVGVIVARGGRNPLPKGMIGANPAERMGVGGTRASGAR
jgi:hypothetical protein